MNYYVMDNESNIVFRGTLEQCEKYANAQVQGWLRCGFQPKTYRIFYDTATEPMETVGW